MSSVRNTRKRQTDRRYDFLVVDEYLTDLVRARALKTALELGLIDELLDRPNRAADDLAQALSVEPRGLAFLLELLSGHQVLDRVDGKLRLHARFAGALAFRDLLEARLDFAGFAASDILELFTGAIADPRGFARRSRVFDLFDYRRALEPTHENYLRTRAWMRFTTVFTRYETRACLDCYDFGRHQRMLDVGGNSGEFALQVCRRHAGLRATVFDLPLVCEIAQEHVLPHAERDRIAFLAGDVRRDPVPKGYDLIVFKSMLHDWPEDDAQRILAAATQVLAPGGTILIYERLPLNVAANPPTFAMIPALLFFRSYREPGVYRKILEDQGLREFGWSEVALEVPFLLATAVKPEAAR